MSRQVIWGLHFSYISSFPKRQVYYLPVSQPINIAGPPSGGLSSGYESMQCASNGHIDHSGGSSGCESKSFNDG